MTLARGQEGSSLICGFRLDAPLFDSGYLHGGMESFQSPFLCGYGHDILTNHC